MAEVLGLEIEFIDSDERTRYDLRTQFAELVDGSMRTEFKLNFNGYDLLGVDGWSVHEIARKSLDDAQRIAATIPELEDEVRRREIEAEEIDEAIAMAAGEGPNTMIVISDFPRWLMDATEDIGGYNIRRKQTMMRVITRSPDGDIKMVSRSLDGSNRQALEKIYTHLDEETQHGELLGQRIRKDLSVEQQETLDSELTGVYDRSMSEQFGGEWYAGRQPIDYRNTYDFVCNQHDLIEECVELRQRGELTDKFIYDVAATMQKRFESASRREATSFTPSIPMSREVLYYELAMNGQQARAEGKTFSACGVTLASESVDNSSTSQMDQAGYGNKSIGEDGECEFISKECPMCHKKNVKTTVKKISIEGISKKRVSGTCGCYKVY